MKNTDKTMELEKRIQADMVAAMKAKEAVKLSSLRAIKAAIMLAKTAEGATGVVSDQDIVKIIQKLVKQRKESAYRKLSNTNYIIIFYFKDIITSHCY